MPVFDVRVYAVESDEFPGMFLGKKTVTDKDPEKAAWRAHDEIWDDGLSATCNPRFFVDSHEARAIAHQFLDASPEDTMSVGEYDWAFKTLGRKDLEDTGLLVDFAAHASNIQLDPEKSDLTRPVVVSLGDKELFPVAVWDGVHRIMSALARGVDGIPAIVGVRKPENGPMLSDSEILDLFGEHPNHPGQFAYAVIDELLDKMGAVSTQNPALSAQEIIAMARRTLVVQRA